MHSLLAEYQPSQHSLPTMQVSTQVASRQPPIARTKAQLCACQLLITTSPLATTGFQLPAITSQPPACMQTCQALMPLPMPTPSANVKCQQKILHHLTNCDNAKKVKCIVPGQLQPDDKLRSNGKKQDSQYAENCTPEHSWTKQNVVHRHFHVKLGWLYSK